MRASAAQTPCAAPLPRPPCAASAIRSSRSSAAASPCREASGGHSIAHSRPLRASAAHWQSCARRSPPAARSGPRAPRRGGLDGRSGPLRAPQDAHEAHEAPDRRRGASPALPRALWVGLAAAAVAWQAAAGRPGAALLLALALAPLAALPRRAGLGWLGAALAPILGLVRLAGAFPAAAGQARGWRLRAALGALGYWWLVLAEPLLGRHLWLGQPHGTPPRGQWEGSLHDAAVHVAGPMLSTGVLLGAALWAAAAVCLPWLVRGRRAALDVVAATMWSAALAAAAPNFDHGLSAGAHAGPRGAVLGAVCGGILAVAARALRGPV